MSHLLFRESLVALCLALACLLPWSSARADDIEDLALVFLANVDSGDYEGAWSKLHSEYRKLGTFEAWKANIGTARDRMGELTRRESTQLRDLTTSVPNLPDGQYLLVRFAGHYERGSVVEIVVLSPEDETWRVAGYGFK